MVGKVEGKGDFAAGGNVEVKELTSKVVGKGKGKELTYRIDMKGKGKYDFEAEEIKLVLKLVAMVKEKKKLTSKVVIKVRGVDFEDDGKDKLR